MQEFKDGTFGEAQPAAALLAAMTKTLPEDVKAVHFGTVEELEAIRKRATAPAPVLVEPVDAAYVSARLDALEARLNEAMARPAYANED